MITTVTQKKMVTIPAEVGRKMGIRPGWKLDWEPVAGSDEIRVRVIPDRAEQARRLLGSARRFSPERDAVAFSFLPPHLLSQQDLSRGGS